jgi:hypothetical protein
VCDENLAAGGRAVPSNTSKFAATKYLYCTYVNNQHNLNMLTDILQSCKKTEILYAEIVFLITKKSTETFT